MDGAPSRARSQTGGIDYNDTHVEACVAANPALAHWEAAKWALHPFGMRNTCFTHAKATPEGYPDATSSMARD
jgi:hypothetical protein